MKDPILWYFADPMCSWCWGFSPVIEMLREGYRGRLKVALILGGLRVGTSEAMSAKQREDILQHWREVQAMTEQPFRFDAVLGEGFIYDTEPACRAVVAMAELAPEAVFPLFKAIQAAFYGEGLDVTQPEQLARLAEGQGVAAPDFLAAFASDAVRGKTLAHFQMARKLDVRGFPTVVAQRGELYQIITTGYRPLDEMQRAIDEWLARAGGASA
ncbi:MAG: DsbA family protein [Gallionellaceae bacterium]|nr:DsbA family protein [Gallionellaceae bacterium]